MADQFSHLDAVAQAELVRRGHASPMELVEAAIGRIEELNPALNAVIHSLFDSARDAARGELPDGPFRGVPFLLKDLDAPLAGAPFHAGMRFLKERNYVAPQNAYYVDKILTAGFVPVGKTNTPELGLTVTTEPEAYGPARNPWNTEHSTGGSSGGSGAAVAARLVPAAHAADGGGSIRIPASECGLVGLKPSRGRVSVGPQYGEYWSGLVANHVVSVSVRDTAQILDCVAGPMPGDPYAAPPQLRPFGEEVGASPGRLRIGVWSDFPGGIAEVHSECVQAVAGAGKLLEQLGHHVEASHPAVLDRSAEQAGGFSGIVGAWVASALNEWGTAAGAEIREEDVEPITWALAEGGRAQTAGDYVNHMKWLGMYTREAGQWWNDFDVLVTPTIAIPPPKIGWLGGADLENPMEGMARILSLLPYTPAFNLTGQPAVSLPLHWTSDGLPVGVQLVGALGREDVLIRVAAQLEEAQPWRDRLPPVCA
ncbi:MAG: amidase [Candidatus Binatia bacterium]|nr:amidase [Candidatus Binatia bacterium]